jgi:hypothetical protein
MNKVQAVDFVHRCAQQHVPEPDRERFVEVVDTQLISLHEGSIARYRLRPSEFQQWRAVWS